MELFTNECQNDGFLLNSRLIHIQDCVEGIAFYTWSAYSEGRLRFGEVLIT